MAWKNVHANSIQQKVDIEGEKCVHVWGSGSRDLNPDVWGLSHIRSQIQYVPRGEATTGPPGTIIKLYDTQTGFPYFLFFKILKLIRYFGSPVEVWVEGPQPRCLSVF